jgi:hypothetical protein
MRFMGMSFNHINLKTTENHPRWGFVYMRRFRKGSWQIAPNLDILLGNQLFTFWGRDK